MNPMIRAAQFVLLLFCGFVVLPTLYAKSTDYARPTEIVFWHSFAGHLGEELTGLVTEFNQSQTQYIIKPIYKGDYVSSLTSFAAAFHAGLAPALVQVYEVGTTTLLIPSGIIKPAEALLREQGKSLPKDSFFPAVRDFYSEGGQLQALPLNTSVPVIFYNADLLNQIGYSESNFPKTWDALEVLAVKLKKAGSACAYTTAFPSWIQIESFSALHGLTLIDPMTHQANYHSSGILKHLTRLKRWQKHHYFEYGGRTSDATVLFTSGRCALFSQSSGSYHSLSKMVPFTVGVAPLPIDTAITAHRYPNVMGGAALWAITGHSEAEYAGIAQFFVFLMQPKIQQQWYERTGYIPLGVSGIYQSLKNSGNHSTLLIAEQDLAHDLSLHGSQVQRGPLNFLRTINDEAMEALFAGIKTPEQAISEALLRANHALMRFKQNTEWA